MTTHQVEAIDWKQTVTGQQLSIGVDRDRQRTGVRSIRRARDSLNSDRKGRRGENDDDDYMITITTRGRHHDEVIRQRMNEDWKRRMT
jgi:hypothetical protein